MAADFRKADLTERPLVMLELAEKLTRTPWLVGEKDREQVRLAGLSSRELLHLVLGCAIFNYLNRVADGLGIPLDYESPIADAVILRGEEPAAPPDGTGSALDEPAAGRREAEGPAEPEELFAALAESPAARDRAAEWRRYLLKGTPDLDSADRRLICSRVSGWNRCEHGRRWFAGEGRGAHIGERMQGLLEHARRLTREPWSVKESHVDALRGLGLDDLGILRFTMLVSYVNFENRVAMGLGVQGGAKT